MRAKAISCLILLSVTCGCISLKPVYYSDDRKRAIEAIARYHDAFNRQDYDAIFEAAHSDAKATKSKEKLRRVLSSLFDQVGKVQT